MKFGRINFILIILVFVLSTDNNSELNLIDANRAEAAEEQGSWRKKSQLVWDNDTKTMKRRILHVWSAEYRGDHDFYWHPNASSGPLQNGPINGSGVLVWRERGAASYDRTSIVATYDGGMHMGRASGTGLLWTRDGLEYSGQWLNGRMHGKGDLRHVNGDFYSGQFTEGRPHGRGRYEHKDGEIYEGEFKFAQKHGEGTLTTVSGATYRSQWENGTERLLSRQRRLAVEKIERYPLPADFKVAVNVNRIKMAVVVDQKLSAQHQRARGGVIYKHDQRPGVTYIAPNSPDLMKRWKGGGVISWSGVSRPAPTYLKFHIENSTGRRQRISSAHLEVAESNTDFQPLLGLNSHWGCIGYRPTFNFTNNGWGKAQNAKLQFAFTRGARASKVSKYAYSANVGTFLNGKDVSIEAALRAAGVNTSRLRSSQFTCPSYEQLPTCGANIKRKLQLGKLGRHIDIEGNAITTTLVGKLQYTWNDSRGRRQSSSSLVKTSISLGHIKVPALAECADLPFAPVPLPNVPKVKFKLDKTNYRLPVQLLGSRNLQRRQAYVVAANADKSSIHKFRFVLVFSDGSKAVSRPVTLQYYNPRPAKFSSSTTPSSCTIEQVC